MCVFVCDGCLANDYFLVSFVDEFYAISVIGMVAESESKTEKELMQSNRWPNVYELHKWFMNVGLEMMVPILNRGIDWLIWAE